MKKFAPSGPVFFISTHLDDVVLSCAAFLAEHPGATVVTVLAGAPDIYSNEREWNTYTTGELYAPDAVGKRKTEDEAAMQFLKAKHVHLDGWDSPYLLDGQKQDENAIVQKLMAVLSSSQVQSIVAPIGLRHSDHIAVGNACQKLANKISTDFYFYLDLPYALAFPDEARNRLGQIEEARFIEELEAGDVLSDVKDHVFKFYKSQYLPIKDDFNNNHGQTYDKAMRTPERYWRLHTSQ